MLCCQRTPVTPVTKTSDRNGILAPGSAKRVQTFCIFWLKIITLNDFWNGSSGEYYGRSGRKNTTLAQWLCSGTGIPQSNLASKFR
jgi:hypothetical protein